MIGRMCGGKAVPTTASYNSMDQIIDRWIIAWSNSLHPVFNKVRTQIIAENKGQKKEKAPFQAICFVICPHPHKQKQIDRCPEIGYSYKRHQQIKYLITHFNMNQFK